MPVNIAIDGPAGAGKSTIAKAVAKELGYIYVDTGALYRAVAYYIISKNIDCNNTDKVILSLTDIHPELKFINGTQHIYLNGNDISDKIRTEQISMGASTVSAISEVRQFLFDLQRNIAKRNNIIMDGRDIGTVVLPDAQLKIYLTASAEKRAERRYRELIEKGEKPDFNDVLEDIKKRDYNDTHRSIAPLKKADNAILADTSDMTLSESVEYILKLARQVASDN